MADRRTLHRSHIDRLREWLINDGWNIEQPKGTWEVLRARKDGRKDPLIVYDRIDGEHLSVLDRDYGVIAAFLRDKEIRNEN